MTDSASSFGAGNALAQAASPYLRQHARNPVDWMEWGDQAMARARAEGKLLLISIGYAACHWCHVMAHECFEDAGIAALMNRHFVCVKVDREERPDVDQVYMEAVQLMIGHGGWPLNCFALPDGRPVYGGTYFRPEAWHTVLTRLATLWEQEPDRVTQEAGQLAKYLQASHRRAPGRVAEGVTWKWPEVYAAFSARFDREQGGTAGAPKFPMPAEWQFLLRYGWAAGDAGCARQVRLTLDRMAAGGLCDQLGGGFARYSTDAAWKVPHFEKMLYDNAQLIELYAEASAVYAEPRYRDAALDAAEFLERELALEGGGYASSLDADSEGEEGRFYAWTRSELESALGERLRWFADITGVDGEGHWERGNNVLLRRYSLEDLAARQGWTRAEAERVWAEARRDLLAWRARRPRPARDDKVLTSWNGLTVRALAAAFRHTGRDVLRQRAVRTADFLLGRARRADGGLWHRGFEDAFAVEGFLEDYALLADGLIELYQVTFAARYLDVARGLADYALEHFGGDDSPWLYFTADTAPPLLVRKRETQDNVIPSSNAVFARVLLALADFFAAPEYRVRAEAMLSAVRAEFPIYAPAYAVWAQTLLAESFPMATLAVVGPEAHAFRDATAGKYRPQWRYAGSEIPADLPLLRGKFQAGATLAFRCQGDACGRPQTDWRQLLESENLRWNPEGVAP